MDSLTLQHIVVIGIVLSLIVSVIVVGSLMVNARLWLQDYPRPIQEKVPPLSNTEKRQRVVVAVLFLGTLLGVIILETLHLRTTQAISFGAAYLDIYLILMVLNLFDAVVLDLIMIAWLRPKFVVIPGMEGMEYLFRDYRKHLTDFLKGVVIMSIISLPFAVIAVL